MDARMNVVHHLYYAPEHGWRGGGDLHLPAERQGAPLALVIHGGSWNALDRRRMSGVADLLAREGYAAYNINYRLAHQAPWPACLDDCLRAGRYLLEGNEAAFEGLDRSGFLLIGASAGGHLALMTGLSNLRSRVAGIVSIAGPADLAIMTRDDHLRRMRALFGRDDYTDVALREASPVNEVSAGAPPLLCVHSTNDRLVRMAHSEAMVGRYAEEGAPASLYAYEGPGTSHGIWRDSSAPPRLLAHIEGTIADFAERVRRGDGRSEQRAAERLAWGARRSLPGLDISGSIWIRGERFWQTSLTTSWRGGAFASTRTSRSPRSS